MLLPVVSSLAHQQEEYVSAANISSKPGRSRGFKCPLWVKSRHRGISNECPLYPQKRTFVTATGMSALCQKRTIAHRHPNAARCGRAQQRQAGCSSTDLIDRRCNAANKVT